jgi:cyclophilin family peptidyl-prolyl cis-trans isomerase
VGTEKRERQKLNRLQKVAEDKKAEAAATRKRQIIKWGSIIGVAAVAIIGIALATKKSPAKVTTAATSTTIEGSATTAPSASTSAAGAPTSDAVAKPFEYGTTECPAATGATPTKTFAAPFKKCIDPAKSYAATFDTSEGKIVANLDTARTPGTTNNFVSLARFGYYDGTPFFRIGQSIDIIQGGGKDNQDSPGFTIPDEGGKFTYVEGDFTMARTGQPNSAGAQFFFSTGPKTANLDGQGTYVNFGKVTEGLDILKKIITLTPDGKQAGSYDGAPSKVITITKVTITEG